MTLSLGLNLWGEGYQPEAHDVQAFDGASFADAHTAGHFSLNLRDMDEIVIVMVVALLLTSVVYAVMYPFSSRLDMGVVGRSGWQQESGADLQLWRNEAGVYLRAYLSQHFPMYIYGSGMFSYQNLKQGARDENHQVFVKGLGLGFMSPANGGLYAHGVWERSTLINPSTRDILDDATEMKILKSSVAEILDGSYFELGYVWHL